jgi:hypothetical protein
MGAPAAFALRADASTSYATRRRAEVHRAHSRAEAHLAEPVVRVKYDLAKDRPAG